MSNNTLDVSPDEFEMLTKVRRDPKVQVEFEVKINPSLLKRPLTPVELVGKISVFYGKNKHMFDNPSDLGFDKNEFILRFKGSESLANELMKVLGLQNWKNASSKS